MNPYAIQFHGINIKWYSIFILAGIMLAWIFVNNEARKFEIKKDFLLNLIFWAVVFGIIGARTYYVAFNWDYYSANINEIWQIWNGGLAIHGGLIAGALVVILYSRKYKVSGLRMLDIASPYILLAQAIGRWGNFMNSEAFGPVTTFEHLKSLKIIPDFVIYGMHIDGYYRTPTFYYESLWCLLGVIVILIIRKLKYTRVGQQIGVYLMWYSVGRFFIESLRTDSLMFGYFKVAQIMSIIMFIAGLVLYLLPIRRPKLENLYKTEEKIEIVNF